MPGLPFPSSTPLFPTRNHFLDYLHRYAETFQLPIQTASDVNAVRRDAGDWTIGLGDGRSLKARTVVIATGIVANPRVPHIPNQDQFKGHVIHSVEYRRPQPFTNQRVLVVGVGNSAGEISAELADAGAQVTVAIRSGARVVPREMFGIPIQDFRRGAEAPARALAAAGDGDYWRDR